MADNLTTQSSTLATIPASSVISTEEVTTLNGGAVSAQHIQRIAAAIRTADGTAVDLPGSTADGLLVNLGANNDVTVTSGTITLGAGTAAYGKLAANSGVDIGDVDVTSVPADPFGVNADAASATGSISAKLRFIASTGIPITGTVTVGSHAVTNAGTFAVQPAGSVAHDASATSVNPVLVGGYASAAAPSAVSADGDAVRAWYNRLGIQAVMIVSSDGITELGFSASGRVEVEASLAAATSGGYTANSYLSVGTSDDSTVISNTACQLAWFYATNTNAAVRYVKIYNKATSPGTGDTPILRLAIPGNTAGAGGTASIPLGLVFSTGLSFRMVTGVADNDGTDVAANEIILNYAYK